MEKKLKAEPSEREILSLKYQQMLERERLRENLPEPEFTKAKRAASDSKVIKANEAPEKIWINQSDLSKLSGHIDNDSIEYTKTDAFIEKACSWFRTLDDKEPPYTTTEKFIEEFKKAMKL